MGIIRTTICLLLIVWNISCDRQENIDKDYPEDILYQYSVIDALLAGVYDGNLTLGKLKAHGDFGLGTFNHLDGELIMHEGTIYRMRYNGSIEKVPDSDSTGLAAVTFFDPDTTLSITGRDLTYAEVQQQLDEWLHQNEIYSIRISGSFSSIQARAPAPAQRPYLPLQQYLSGGGQHDFSFRNVSGTGVGFRLPPYMARTNVPGYHIHFISDDLQKGGHVFEFTADSLFIEIDKAGEYMVELNTHPDFLKADLQKNRQQELEEVE